MARLSTHVLDTSAGKPGAGIAVDLYRVQGASRELVKSAVTNADGRTDATDALAPGTYELLFGAGQYHRAQGSDANFLDEVVIRFNIADAAGHYHVPLLLSPFGYTTYRGS
jgi:5-hydroxyisourate hydrolase